MNKFQVQDCLVEAHAPALHELSIAELAEALKGSALPQIGSIGHPPAVRSSAPALANYFAQRKEFEKAEGQLARQQFGLGV